MSGARPLYPRKQTFVIAAARLDLECIATPPRDKLRSIVTPRGQAALDRANGERVRLAYDLANMKRQAGYSIQ